MSTRPMCIEEISAYKVFVYDPTYQERTPFVVNLPLAEIQAWHAWARVVVNAGHKVQAVKRIRDEFKIDLKSAKLFVEQLNDAKWPVSSY